MTAETRSDQVRELLADFTLTESAPGTFEVTPPDWYGPRLFGGHTVAYATAAAARVDGGHRGPHSAHCYFLRPVRPSVPLTMTVEVVRRSRSFRTNEVRMAQDGACVFTMTAQFHEDETAEEWQPPSPVGEGPSGEPDPWDWGPFELLVLPNPVAAVDATEQVTRRHWVRLTGPLPDDAATAAAVAAYVSDMTASGARPLSLGRWDGYLDASLDHALWFHRPIRLDEWALFEVRCAVNHAGRSLIRGSLYDADGRLCLSMAQEMLIREI
ncbi:MAG: thioesterase family protein [Frankiales bacterium]|nr:thioesterase family protein [Frankiales bacterium]